MKTHTIKTPTSELMVVELAEGWDYEPITDDKTFIYHKTEEVTNDHHIEGYTILGKPDEIREEDAEQVVEQSREIPFTVYNAYFGDGYKNYKDDNSWFTNPIKSLLSLLDTEIYWENPYLKPLNLGDGCNETSYKIWHEAEQKTFNRNRSIIFVKN